MVVIVGSRVVIAPTLAGELDPDMLSGYLVLLTYGAVLVATGLNLNVFTAQPMIRDKKKHILESVLATPISVRKVWVSRTLAVYFPGLCMGTAAGLVSLGIWKAQIAGFVPVAGGRHAAGLLTIDPALAALGGAGIVSAFLIVPIVYLTLALLVQLVGLSTNPVTGNVIAQVSLQAVAISMVNLGVHRIVEPGSTLFVAIHLGTAAAAGVVVLLTLRLLTKERVVLSARAGTGAGA